MKALTILQFFSLVIAIIDLVFLLFSVLLGIELSFSITKKIISYFKSKRKKQKLENSGFLDSDLDLKVFQKISKLKDIYQQLKSLQRVALYLEKTQQVAVEIQLTTKSILFSKARSESLGQLMSFFKNDNKTTLARIEFSVWNKDKYDIYDASEKRSPELLFTIYLSIDDDAEERSLLELLREAIVNKHLATGYSKYEEAILEGIEREKEMKDLEDRVNSLISQI